MKKLLILVAILFGGAAHAGPMANVEYVHKVIEQHWGINVPYNPALENPKIAANMKYLLTAVDVANKILNGESITDYGNGEYATMAAADTIATDEAVNRLIVNLQPQFFVTTTPDTTEFGFTISAIGTFFIDWGDGEKEIVKRTDTSHQTYNHIYNSTDEHKIGIGGKATAYRNGGTSTAISFSSSSKKLAKIAGSLGAIFSTIGDGRGAGQQPNFYTSFNSCSELKEIPANLFTGIKGEPAAGMFSHTFGGTGITEIPENLFTGLKGAPAASMFSYTFYNCRGLKSIPENLFAGIKGAPAEGMFHGTFMWCNRLQAIPENLFAGISGTPARDMFTGTFNSCSGLTSIPENLFGNISGLPQDHMFANTFAGCTNLSGPSARINGTPLYEIWPSATSTEVGECYHNATGLSDYEEIPAGWK